jgi:hypothetical protein
MRLISIKGCKVEKDKLIESKIKYKEINRVMLAEKRDCKWIQTRIHGIKAHKTIKKHI